MITTRIVVFSLSIGVLYSSILVMDACALAPKSSFSTTGNEAQHSLPATLNGFTDNTAIGVIDSRTWGFEAPVGDIQDQSKDVFMVSNDKFYYDSEHRRSFIEALTKIKNGGTIVFVFKNMYGRSQDEKDEFTKRFCNLHELQGNVSFEPLNGGSEDGVAWQAFKIKYINFNDIFKKMIKMEAFLNLVELCNEYEWLLEGDFYGSRYLDKTFLGFKEYQGALHRNDSVYLQCTDAELDKLIEGLTGMVRHRLIWEKEGKVKQMKPRAKRKLVRLAAILGIQEKMGLANTPYPLDKIKTIRYVASDDSMGPVQRLLEDCPNARVELIDPVFEKSKLNFRAVDFHLLEGDAKRLVLSNREGRAVEVILDPSYFEHFTPEPSAGPAIYVIQRPGHNAHLSETDGFYLKLIKDMEVGDLVFLRLCYVRAKGNVFDENGMVFLPSSSLELEQAELTFMSDLHQYDFYRPNDIDPYTEYFHVGGVDAWSWLIYRKSESDSIGEAWRDWYKTREPSRGRKWRAGPPRAMPVVFPGNASGELDKAL